MSSFRVNDIEMQTAAGRFADIVSQLDDAWSKLKSLEDEVSGIESLKGYGYPGQIYCVRSQLTGVQNTISSLGRQLTMIISEYTSCEEQVRQLGANALEVSTKAYSSGILSQGATELTSLGAGVSATSLLSVLTKANNFSIKDLVKYWKKGQELGKTISTILSGDPVNLKSGNFVYGKSFLTHTAPLPMEIHVFYNAMDSEGGILGRGWILNCEVHLYQKGNRVIVRNDTGNLSIFTSEDGLSYLPLPGTVGSLVMRPEGGWTWMDEDGVIRNFDAAGQLASEEGEDGYRIQLEQENGALQRVFDTRGNVFRFFYGENGNLGYIEDQADRKVSFEYTDKGDLCSITDPEMNKTEFSYNRERLLFHVKEADGTISLENEFDEKGRTIRQHFPDGGSDQYIYDDENRTSTEIRPDGSRRVLYSDGEGRVCRLEDSAGSIGYSYNERDLYSSLTDRKGNVTSLEYDVYGNISVIRDPEEITSEIVWRGIRKPERVLINGTEVCRALYDEKERIAGYSFPDGSETRWAFDEKDRPVEQILANGSRAKISYDESGRIHSYEDPAYGVTTYEYDAAGNVRTITDEAGGKTQFSYDGNGNVISIINALGYTRTCEYDPRGNLTGLRDFDGSVRSWKYDAMNRIVAETDAENHTIRYTYDLAGNVTGRSNENGESWQCEYDAQRNPTRLVFPDGTEESYVYDPNGNLIQRTAQDGGIWEIDYDGLDRPVRVTDPMGNVRSATYDVFGNVTKIDYGSGVTEEAEYDLLGRMTSRTDRRGYRTEYRYDISDNLTEVSDENGWIARFSYDLGNRLTDERYAYGKSCHYSYDRLGRIVRMKDSYGETELSYDSLGRITSIIYADGSEEKFAYDPMGRLISHTDGEGDQTVWEYSKTGYITKQTDPAGASITYEYDRADRLARILQSAQGEDEKTAVFGKKQKNTKVTSYVRNRVGLIEKIVQPDQTALRFTYDACGRLASETDEEGNEIHTVYRPDGHPLEAKVSDGKSVRWEYDGLGQVRGLTDWLGSMRFDRDPMNELLFASDQKNRSVKYERGRRGLCTKMIYPDGQEVSYIYDHAGRLTEAHMADAVMRYGYNAAGDCVSIESTDGTSGNFSYDCRGRIAGLRWKKGEKLLSGLSLIYDRAGQIKEAREERENQESSRYSYEYDPRGLLTAVRKDGNPFQSFQYDCFGNRTETENAGVKTSYAYDIMNRLVRESGPSGDISYHYDRRGNLIGRTGGENPLRLTFDALSRLSSSESLRGRAEYQYNALQMRASASFAMADGTTVTEEYFHDPGRNALNLLYTTDGTHSSDVVFGTGIDGFIRDRIFTPAVTDMRTSILYADKPLCYDTFGAASNDAAAAYMAAGTRYAYAGMRSDPITGFLHANRREYDPAAGRFISPDPVAAVFSSSMMLNYYLYCKNNPVNYFDPAGLFLQILAGAAVGAVTGLAKQGVKAACQAISGQPVTVTWQDCVGSAVGGAVTGGLTAAGVPMCAAQAAGSAVETLSTNGLKMVTGTAEKGYTAKNLALDTAKSAAEGFVTGAIAQGISAKFDSAAGNKKFWQGIKKKIPDMEMFASAKKSARYAQAALTRAIHYGTEIHAPTVKNIAVAWATSTVVSAVTDMGKSVVKRTAVYIGKQLVCQPGGGDQCPLNPIESSASGYGNLGDAYAA